MLINQNLSQELYEDAGHERTTKAKEYVKSRKSIYYKNGI